MHFVTKNRKNHHKKSAKNSVKAIRSFRFPGYSSGPCTGLFQPESTKIIFLYQKYLEQSIFKEKRWKIIFLFDSWFSRFCNCHSSGGCEWTRSELVIKLPSLNLYTMLQTGALPHRGVKRYGILTEHDLTWEGMGGKITFSPVAPERAGIRTRS